MSIKEFSTAVRSVPDDEAALTPAITVTIDGTEVTFSGASEGQMAVVLAATSDTSGLMTSMADIINFFFALIESTDERRYVKVRLLDKNDPFGLSEIMDICVYLIEEWSARPTQPPSDSTPLPSNGGRRSTGRQPRVVSTR